MTTDTDAATAEPGDVERFWTLARRKARLESLPGYFGPSTLEVLAPPTWSFGATPEQADALLDLVLAGTKTATSSARADYDTEGDLPQVGGLDIVLDSVGRPRALLKTLAVAVLPFGEVDDEHARREGEGDLSLAHWREVHERFFREHSLDGEPVTDDTLVVLERFQVLYQE